MPTIIAFRSIQIEAMVEEIKLKLHLLLIKLLLIEKVRGDIILIWYWNNRVYSNIPCKIRKHDMCVVGFKRGYENDIFVIMFRYY